MLRIAFSALTALALAACANTGEETASAGARDCFRSENVNGFNMVDRNTIEVRVGASRRYLLTTNWPADELNYAERIAIRSTTGQICTGNGLGVEIFGGRPPVAYPIQAIARAPEPAAQN